MEHGIRTEDLIEHREFLRALARSLIGDAQRADDVVQDAFVTALERPPSSPRSLRAWLVRVVQNLSRNVMRGDRRRAFREQASARAEKLPSHEEMFESLDLSRQVVEAVQALPELYRAALFLRFYEGRSVTSIATDLGLPRDTVKTRVRRALEKLRAELDTRSGGDRRRWMSALLPLTAGPGLTPATSVACLTSATPAAPVVAAESLVGGLLVMKKLVLAVVVSAVLLAGLYSVGILDPAEAPAAEPVAGLEAPPASREAEDSGLARPAALPPGAELLRSEVKVSAEPPAGATEEATAASRLAARSALWCRVVDADTGQPVEGAIVSERPFEWPGFGPRSAFEPAESNVKGLVELHASAWIRAVARVEAAGFGPAMFRVAEGHETPERALEVRLARSAELVVRLLDADSTPMVGARIELSTPCGSLLRPEGSSRTGNDGVAHRPEFS